MQARASKYCPKNHSLLLEDVFLPGTQDDVDLLRFVLASAFRNKGLMVGGLPPQELRLPTSASEVQRMSRTVTMSNIKPREYYSKENATLLAYELVMRDAEVTTSLSDGPKNVTFVVPQDKVHANAGSGHPDNVPGRIFRDASHNVKVLCQMYHIKAPAQKRIKIKNPRDPSRCVFIGCLEVGRPLTWNYHCRKHSGQPVVIPRARYSHLCHMSDFGPVTDGSQLVKDNKEPRYACVENILGTRSGYMKASGITLLPSEYFARIVADLVCFSEESYVRVELSPGLQGICSLDRGDGSCVGEWSGCELDRELTLDDWKVINKIRRMVSDVCLLFVRVCACEGAL